MTSAELVKIYQIEKPTLCCHAQSRFFPEVPHYNYLSKTNHVAKSLKYQVAYPL